LVFERKITDLSVAVFSTQVIFTIPLFVALRWPNIAPGLAGLAVHTMWVAFLISVLMVSIGWAKNDKQISDAAPAVAFVGATVFFITLGVWKRRKVKDEPA
ncbi:MAG: hypothetical protein M3247_07160, partial [Thermoproteota archaeon]|nr:hypothetical protein [Thermoproteota archaeon]